MPQRSQELGRIVPFKIFQTIATAGDTVEGIHDPAGTSEENLLEILCQNWRTIHISGRNEDDTNTSTFRFYATQKFNATVPATGNSFWDVTEDHWEQLSADQAAVATNTNITPINIVDEGWTYVVVTIQSAVASTETIGRAVLTG